LIDERNPPKRNTYIDISEEEQTQNRETVKSILPALWNENGKWRKDSDYFDITKQYRVFRAVWTKSKPLAKRALRKANSGFVFFDRIFDITKMEFGYISCLLFPSFLFSFN
jgi:hypothetical protein